MSKTAIPKILPIQVYQFQIPIPTTAYCVKKGNLHFSYALEHDLLEKKVKIKKKSSYKVLSVQKGGFQETTCPGQVTDYIQRQEHPCINFLVVDSFSYL